MDSFLPFFVPLRWFSDRGSGRDEEPAGKRSSAWFRSV